MLRLFATLLAITVFGVILANTVEAKKPSGDTNTDRRPPIAQPYL